MIKAKNNSLLGIIEFIGRLSSGVSTDVRLPDELRNKVLTDLAKISLYLQVEVESSGHYEKPPTKSSTVQDIIKIADAFNLVTPVFDLVKLPRGLEITLNDLVEEAIELCVAAREREEEKE